MSDDTAPDQDGRSGPEDRAMIEEGTVEKGAVEKDTVDKRTVEHSTAVNGSVERSAARTPAVEIHEVKIHGALRASDTERDDALQALAAHYADGRLERAEFDERAEVALAARTRDQLHALFADLPGPVPVPSSTPEVVPAAPRTPERVAEARLRQRPAGFPPPIVFSPVLFVFAIVAVLYGAPPFPLIPLVFILTGGPRRWDRQARPWN